MTGTCGADDGVSRREFMVAAGAATVVAGAIGATPTPAAAAMPANEMYRMDAVTLVEKIRNKQLSATEVTEAVLARMEKLDPVLGAFCTPSPDVARAQAKAVEADIMAGRSAGCARRGAGRHQGPSLHQGHQDHVGVDHLQGFRPTEDDVVVERLKAAGAVMIGKTNVPELGYERRQLQPDLSADEKSVEY